MNRVENINLVLSAFMSEQHVEAPLPDTLVAKQRLMRALMNTRPPWKIDATVQAAQDRELQMQLADKGVVDVDDIKEVCATSKERVLLWQGDITRLRTDAIVNAANGQMLGCWHPLHACIDNCIHSAAGVQLRNECQRLMCGEELPTGKARITRAYNLPCKYVVHTVGPIVEGEWPTDVQERQLADCYVYCLRLAKEHGCSSIAFCCISTGVFGFPQQRAAEIAVQTVVEANTAMTVVFNVFKDSDYEIYQHLLATS